MKYVFNNKRILTFSILFALTLLALVALFLCQLVLHVAIPTFVFIIVIVCLLTSGGYLAQLRSGPPW